MMSTPRVTEIPIPMAPVEPDPFIEVSLRGTAAQRRLSERGSRDRQMEMVRRAMRLRRGFAKERDPT